MRPLRPLCARRLALLVCLLAPLAGWAQASVPRVLHYEGLIQAAGAPHTGPLELRFQLLDDTGTVDWQEAWTGDQAVAVDAGRFRVNLGQLIPLPDEVWSQPEVYLKVAVRAPGAADWVPLAGRHRVAAVPTARWTKRATDLNVAGPATVGGPVTVGGRLSAGAVTAGWIAAQSARFDRLSVTGIGGADVTRGGLVLAQPLVAGSFTSNAAAVPVGRLTSPVTLVDGALSVPGGLTLTGSLTLSGVTRLTFSDNRQPVALLNGELTLNPNNSYNGGTIINSRALQFASINHHGRLWAGSLVTSSTVINAPDSTLTVAGAATAAATTVAGGLSVPDCRICLTYGSPGVRSKRVCAHADVGTGRNASATLALNGPVDGAHNFGMTYVCDGARTNEAGFFP